LLLGRRAWLLAASALLLSLLGGSLPGQEGEETIHLVLLHTNDVHGQARPRPATWIDRDDPPAIGGLPRLAAYVQRVRDEVRETGSGLVVVDGGDWFQGTPEGLVDHGRAFAGALAGVGYDALAVGNHELDYGVEHLAGLIADLELPALCANLRLAPEGERVPWARPWKIVEAAGLRVGIVGLLTPVTPTITHRDASALHFEEPGAALAVVRKELGEQVDWILPITHLGVQGDRRLAKAHPDLDVIVGGHSHTYLKEGTRQGETWILQAGSKASAVGRLDLWFDAHTKELRERRYQMVDLLEEPAESDLNERVEEVCHALVARSEREMSEPVAELLEPLERSFQRTRSATAGNWITDTMRARLEADVAIQNRGGIRCDLQAGAITRRDLFELLPFGNHLVLLELSGEELFECVRASVEGTAHTGLEVSGMTIRYRVGAEGETTLVDLRVAGEPLERERAYTLATNDFLARGGDGYATLAEARVLREDPILLRELLEERCRKEERVTPPEEDRYASVAPGGSR